MGNLREAFEYASTNPNSEFAKNLKSLAQSGALNVEAKKFGIDLTPFQPKTLAPTTNNPQYSTSGINEGDANALKAANTITKFTGGDKLGAGLATATRVASGSINQTGEAQATAAQDLNKILSTTQPGSPERKRLMDVYSRTYGGGTQVLGQEAIPTQAEIDPGTTLTNKEVLGDALQVATTVIGAGQLPGAAKAVTKTPGIVKGAIAGAKTGAKAGLLFGASSGVSQGLKDNKSGEDIVKEGLVGGAIGGIGGGVVGGLIGGVSGGLESRALRDNILSAQEKAGLRPSLAEAVTTKTKTDPKFNLIVKEAKKQGFGDSEINFLSTVSEKDKPVMQKMYDLTVKAQSDPRQIIRAGDVLGENVTNQVKQVIGLNKKAGQAVDISAKALKGKGVDVAPLAQKITSKLSDVGISLADNGTLDFSQSVFKNTPAIQKELQKVILSVPDGSDAYQLHIFKKSLDEILDYGTAGEGLKGSAANILKSFRSSADEVLDNTFADYNNANTSYKLTRDYIDMAKGMVGKKVDLSSKEGSQAFGQALRSAFSNNKSRPNTLKFIEDTHLISKQLGLTGSEKNLLDQALFVKMLEETFGSEAATGLAGEVSKAINKSMSVIEGVKNPLKGAGQAAGYLAEKAMKISPEAKKQILKAFIR